jgi:hypothetical protein
MFKVIALLLAVALICLAIAVLFKPVGKWGFRALADGEPDVAMGTLALVGSVLLMAFVVFVVSRRGAAPGGTVYAFSLAIGGLAYGLAQLSAARKRKRSRGDAK